MTTDAPSVIAVDETEAGGVDIDRWVALAGAAFVDCGVTAGECNLLFVEPPAIHALNNEHMGKDRPTDVLSFPLDGPDASDPTDLIGDIVVCPEVAAANAPEHAGDGHHDGSLDSELALLVVHGVLHLLGHDHVDDAEAEVMEALEQRLLAAHLR